MNEHFYKILFFIVIPFGGALFLTFLYYSLLRPKIIFPYLRQAWKTPARVIDLRIADSSSYEYLCLFSSGFLITLWFVINKDFVNLNRFLYISIPILLASWTYFSLPSYQEFYITSDFVLIRNFITKIEKEILWSEIKHVNTAEIQGQDLSVITLVLTNGTHIQMSLTAAHQYKFLKNLNLILKDQKFEQSQIHPLKKKKAK